MKKYEKRERGITLIALVITIIILLILAGIAIAALSGENGILSRASEAKQKTGREEIIEQARIKIMEKQTENFGTLTEQELTDILTPAYGTLSNKGETTVLDKILTTANGEYEIPVKEIYNSILTKGKIKFIVGEPGSIRSCEFEYEQGVTWEDIYKEVISTYSEPWPGQAGPYFANSEGVGTEVKFDSTHYIVLERKKVMPGDLVKNGVIYDLLSSSEIITD